MLEPSNEGGERGSVDRERAKARGPEEDSLRGALLGEPALGSPLDAEDEVGRAHAEGERRDDGEFGAGGADDNWGGIEVVEERSNIGCEFGPDVVCG